MKDQSYAEDLLRALMQLPVRMEAVCDALRDDHDWEPLLQHAATHRVLPLLHGPLQSAKSKIPPEVWTRIEDAYQRNLLLAMANTSELLQVISCFDAEGIRCLPLKGCALSAAVYGDPSLRASGDIDLLIDRERLERASELLRLRGYELVTRPELPQTGDVANVCEHRFERAVDGSVLELRWQIDLISDRLQKHIDIDWLWPECRAMQLAGASIPGLSAERMLVYLCMHGCKHQWSRLSWICDVARLLANTPELDWPRATADADAAGLYRCLALGVLLAVRVTGVAIPDHIQHRFKRDRTARIFSRQFDETLFRDPGKLRGGLLPYNVALLSWRDRLALALSFRFLHPRERDYTFVALPRPLHFLYYLIRPLRLIADRTAR